MAGDGNFHSRVVGWLKVVLPLAALAILSTMFLISNQVGPTTTIPYSATEIEDRLREPRMTAPEYSGVTSDGSALSIKAATASPDADGGGRASALVGQLDTMDGQKASLIADAGEIDADARVINLTGGVTVNTSTGYRVQGDAFRASMDETKLESTSPVVADGPPGRITADSMVLKGVPGAKDAYVLVFNGGVKLVYQPPK